jgi:hypothetical protein
MIIPKQLQNSGFRFIKIKLGTKIPIERDWPKHNNYQWNSLEMQNWLKHNNNYGVCCGFGNLAVLDVDDPILLSYLKLLPRTFVIRTGSGGVHAYFICEDLDSKVILKTLEGKHLGEIQWKGQQVVAPKSTHPNGNKYEVMISAPIADVTQEQLKVAFKKFWKTHKKVNTAVQLKKQVGSISSLTVTDIISTAGMQRSGDEFLGCHPGHGCTSHGHIQGHKCINFAVNPSKNVWHCYACGSGGSVFELIAVLEGLISCDQAQKGCLDGSIFKQVLACAILKYGLRSGENG